MTTPQIITDNETGEAYYRHPATGVKVYLEPEDDFEAIVDGWDAYENDAYDREGDR